MWVGKIRIVHDCIFGNRCKKFGVELQILSFDSHVDGRYFIIHHLGRAIGEKSPEFLANLKKEKRLEYFEKEGSTFFAVEKREKKDSPGALFNFGLIYVRPATINKLGEEDWEIASTDKEKIIEFCKQMPFSKLVSIKKMHLTEIHFPIVAPHLSVGQQNAFDLAVRNGYYSIPKEKKLDQLAKMAKISRATFREHLRRAELKLLGSM